MNINDFLLTVSISLTLGLLLGYFLRDVVQAIRSLYTNKFKRSQYFELDTKQED